MRRIEAMLGADLSDLGRRFEARDVIAPVVARWAGARGCDELRAAFDAAGVCRGACQVVSGDGARRGNRRVMRPRRRGVADCRDPPAARVEAEERNYGCLCAPKAPTILPTLWYAASNVPAIPVGVASSFSVLVRCELGRFE